MKRAIIDGSAAVPANDTARTYNAKMLVPVFRLVTESELPALLELMPEFYRDQQMHFELETAAARVKQMLTNRELGRAMLIYVGDRLAGYVVLTFCFSFEYGRFGLLDELYILPPFQRQGIGREVIARIEAICREQEMAALRLEVGYENPEAQVLYIRAGFRPDPRHIMTKWVKA
ncbi:MAG TPA: GNAT family N-acetyltransferase [Candidatus Limnocylindrales bacterium]|nr:GNAT family N-acetyltransferase [Candidatus Limnocylindrales bacterium]